MHNIISVIIIYPIYLCYYNDILHRLNHNFLGIGFSISTYVCKKYFKKLFNISFLIWTF